MGVPCSWTFLLAYTYASLMLGFVRIAAVVPGYSNSRQTVDVCPTAGVINGIHVPEFNPGRRWQCNLQKSPRATWLISRHNHVTSSLRSRSNRGLIPPCTPLV
jgi:hypothetical protein